MNRWGYVEGNPISRVDPSGYAYCEPSDEDCLSGYYQGVALLSYLGDSYSPHAEPEDWGVVGDARRRNNVTTPPPGIIWNPSVKLTLATQFVGENQYYVDVNLNGIIDEEEEVLGFGYPQAEISGIWGFNLCGHWSTAMVLEAITGQPHFLSSLYYVLGQTHQPTFAYQLGIAVASVTDPNKVDHWVHELNVRRKMKADGTHAIREISDRPYCVDCSTYPNWLRNTLSKNHFYIALVGIDTTEDGILIPDGGTNHWVIITGFSSQWNNSNINSRWNWVRIMNPFYGREEYYWWNEFRNSVLPGHGLEVWEK